MPGLAARVGSTRLTGIPAPGPGAEAPRPPDSARRGEPARPGSGQLAEGTILQGRYRILGVLGSGGMSTVYKAQDLRFPKVQRLCAVKEMINTATDPRVRALMMQNFEREASILATLNHPAIPQVYDYFIEGDRAYLVTELIHGKDLEALLNETEGFFPEAQVVQWAIQVCDVLTYLHTHKPQPIVFRDMKPSNLMLDDQGRIRLVDFGIAKVFQSGEKGTMIGTEGYSPPEQYRGIAEPRGDIYALGATLHHLLTKQDPRLEPPFTFHKRPIHQYNPAVSAELQEIINRALEYDIQKRFGSAEEMKRALLSLKSARGLAATAYMPAPEGVRPDALKVIWQFACEDEVRSSPCIYEGVLYIGAYDNNLYALDAETGKFLWKYATGGGIASSPAVADGRLFFGSTDGSLYALNAETGRLLWTYPTKGRIYSSPRVQFGHVFIGSDDRHLYAVNAISGRMAWSMEAEGAVRSTPATGPDAIYVGDEEGVLHAVGVNGRLLWRFRARRAITSSPVRSARTCSTSALRTGIVYALDLRAGWVVWRYRTDGLLSPPQRSRSGRCTLAPPTGMSMPWMPPTATWSGGIGPGDRSLPPPPSTRGRCTSGSVDGYVYSLDAQTGQLRWRFQTGGPRCLQPPRGERHRLRRVAGPQRVRAADLGSRTTARSCPTNVVPI
jgi:outer membrane protein assembly factor BamB/tRNA A-37 threonylcarbamoyl transferase component Bud32